MTGEDDREDRRRVELVEAIEKGEPLKLGDGLPAWTPDLGESPPRELVVTAVTLRGVLLDRDLAERADPRGLAIEGAIVVGDLDLDGIQATYSLRLSDCCITGVISLVNARIAGRLSMSGACLTGADDDGDSLIADGMQVDNNVLLHKGFTAAGAIRLLGAHIAGQLNMQGARLNGRDKDGDSLIADNMQADNDVYVGDGFAAAGAVRLLGAHIAGQFVMRGARVDGTDSNGNSLIADGMQVGNNVYLEEGFTAAGAIRLLGAHIAGQLSMRGARVDGTDSNGNSLIADNMQVGNNVYLHEGFTAAGAIRLLGAHIAGQLSMRGARVDGTDSNGNSLIADNMRAGNDVYVGDGFAAAGAIRLLGAHFTGQLNMRGARLDGADTYGNSLIADNMRADSNVYFDNGLSAARALRLNGAIIDNLVVADDRALLPKFGDATGWQIRDVHGVIRNDRKAAAALLDSQLAAQPWHELSAVYDRNGQPTDARWMRYQAAIRSTRHTRGIWRRFPRHIYRWTTGHGYYPLVALVWLFAIFIVAWILAISLADEFTTATSSTIREDLRLAAISGREVDPSIPLPVPGRAVDAWCNDSWDVSCLNPLEYALATAVPVAASSRSWAPPDNGWAPIAFGALRLFAWAFAAVLLAGLTGLLRQQT